MNILKPVKYALIKDVPVILVSMASDYLLPEYLQIETIDEVSELELAFSNLNVNFT